MSEPDRASGLHHVTRILEELRAFADDMRDQGIHVALGDLPVCVTCGQVWPCESSQSGRDK